MEVQHSTEMMVLPHMQCTFTNMKWRVEVPKHVCPVCNKTFRASSLLDIHMRVHVGAKPFVCPVCNHRATQKGNLKLHMKKHHGRDLPSHIDLVPDSGIWGSFPQAASTSDGDMNSGKKTALAHSSLLNEDVIDLIKKCQNNIGQSTMGRITESLNDFVNIAQQKVCGDGSDVKADSQKKDNSVMNTNPNNIEIKVDATKQPCKNAGILANVKSGSSLEDCSTITQHRSSDADALKQAGYCYCKICGWRTSSSGYLNVHMRKHKSESHICTICGRAFKETWYLKNHMRSHINNVAHAADERNTFAVGSSRKARNFQPMNSTLDEKYLHEQSNQKAILSMCYNCGLVFPKRLLPMHTKVCGKTRKHNENCLFCENKDNKSVFMLSLGLQADASCEKEKKHVKNFNSIIGNYAASQLDGEKVAYDNVSSLRRVMEGSLDQHNTKETEKQLQKLVNKPSFKTLLPYEHIDSMVDLFPANRASSLLKNNTNFSSLKPSFTDKPYRHTSMQSLAHIGKLLLDEKTNTGNADNTFGGSELNPQGYKCQFCLKCFKYRSVLGIHMRSHTGERPYKCPFCEYAGTQHNCLKLHMQRHHPDECAGYPNNIPLKSVSADEAEQEEMLLEQASKFSAARCPICSRVSPSPGYLKIHMRSHKKTLDHICPICGRGFKEYWYLSTHLRTHDQEINVLQTTEPTNSSDNALDVSSSCMQATLRNALLSKQRSLPIIKQEENHVGHSYLSGSASWIPLHGNDSNGRHSPAALPETLKTEPVRHYVSKRKAFQPYRHSAEPYPTEVNSRCRKSTPRKLNRITYLAPVHQELPNPVLHERLCETKEMEDVGNVSELTDDDQPLDLTVSTSKACSSATLIEFADTDEPLNLALKN